MKYCSECGAPVALRWVVSEARDRYACPNCGITHYQNPRVIVGCVVSWRDKILFCRRSHEPGRGQWMIPLGFLECGETLEEGAARETLEETGVYVDPADLALCSIINMTAINQVAISFRTAFVDKPAIQARQECSEVAFMSEDEIVGDELAWASSMGNGPRKFYEELRSGNYSIQLITLGSVSGGEPCSREYKLK
jgi:ADP-ribose pyrophosphatase YjhB (NUDIX family)